MQSVEGRVSRKKDEEQMLQIKNVLVIFEEKKGGLTFTVGWARRWGFCSQFNGRLCEDFRNIIIEKATVLHF